MQFPPLATTSVGSFPRPTWLASTERNQLHYKLGGDDRRRAMDDATILTLHEQEQLGIDIVTDGEMRRDGFIFHIAGAWEGVDTQRLGRITRHRNRAVDRAGPRIAGKIVHRPSPAVDDVVFARAHTKLPIKYAVPGPMTVIDSTANEFYADEAELAMDIAAALNAELLAMQKAGCAVLQIDEPAMTRYHDKVRAYGVKALDRCLDGVHVPVIVHLCYGYPGGVSLQHDYSYADLLPLLMQSRIGGFTVEYGRSEFDPAILRACGDRIVMFGCVDPGNSPALSADAVARRVEGALKHLDPARVWLAPDCGLMTISRDLAHAKLTAMVAAARLLRGR